MTQTMVCTKQPDSVTQRHCPLVGAVAEKIHDRRVIPDHRFGVSLLPISERKAVDVQDWCNINLSETALESATLEVVSEGFAVLQFQVTL